MIATQLNRFSALLLCVLINTLAFVFNTHAQTATIDDAWWLSEQDCDGDGCKAGAPASGVARLEWDPDISTCSGTLNVFEMVYSKPCASTNWVLLTNTPAHVIRFCSGLDLGSVEVALNPGCACYDYKIEVYRVGQGTPDYTRSDINDTNLNDHFEELGVEDACPNDSFATCTVISGSFGLLTANNCTTTKEPGEPDHAGNPGGKSLWYCWTAPSNGPVTFDTGGSSFDTLLAVYTGSNVSNLTLVASNNDIAGSTNRQSRVTFAAISNTTYSVAIDGSDSACGFATLNWRQEPLPDLIIWGPAASPQVVGQTFATNDCEVTEGCVQAGTRCVLRFRTEARNIGSGDLVIGDPISNPLFGYSPCHGHYHFDHFAEYRLRDTNGMVVAISDKVGFCFGDVVRWDTNANPAARYTCAYSGLQAGWSDIYVAGIACQYIDITGLPGGNYTLEMELDPHNLLAESNETNNLTIIPLTIVVCTNCTSAPTNDNFVNPQLLTGTPVSISANNSCAIKEAGEPNHAGNAGGHSLWYAWTAPSTRTTVISTEGSTFNTLLAVYTGSNVVALSEVASNNDIPTNNPQSLVTFEAAAGTAYQIAVDGSGGALGGMQLNIDPPGNDALAACYVIAGLTGTTNGHNIGAYKQSGEPAHAGNFGGHSVWYGWTAPADGPVEFNTIGSAFDTTLAVYTGTNIGALHVVASDDNSGNSLASRLGFPTVAGTAYSIAVDGFAGSVGNITLNWNTICRLAAAAPAGEPFQISITGPYAQQYILQCSSNLMDWVNLTTNTMPGVPPQYTETPAFARRFYRALWLP